MPANEDADTRQRRLQALSALAQGHAGATPSDQRDRHSTTVRGVGQQRRRWRPRPWQTALLVVVAIAVVIAAVVVVQRHGVSPRQISQAGAPVEILPRLAGFDCPQDMAWSPNGARVALLGYELQCPVELLTHEYDAGPALAPHDSPIDSLYSVNAGKQPLVGLLVVYDSHTGKMLLRAQPDAAIQRRFPIPDDVTQDYASVHATPELEIHYTHALWLPNGDSLAITFTTFVPTGPPPAGSLGQPGAWPGTAVYGVVLADLNGGLRVLSATVPYPGPAPIREWDLTAGRMIALPPALVNQMSVSSRSSLAPGLAYAWGANGALAIADPLPTVGATPSASALIAPIGSAQGGATFTIWQAGQLDRERSGTSDTAITVWATDFPAISPDGRYVLDAVSLDGQLQPEGAGSPTALQLPIRDAGVRQYLTMLSTRQTYGETNAAWRPDGRVFAAQQGSMNGSGAAPLDAPNEHAVLLLDCQTGALIARLVPFAGRLAAVAPGEPNLLNWSPDGSRLLLFDSALGTVTIWAPAVR